MWLLRHSAFTFGLMQSRSHSWLRLCIPTLLCSEEAAIATQRAIIAIYILLFFILLLPITFTCFHCAVIKKIILHTFTPVASIPVYFRAQRPACDIMLLNGHRSVSSVATNSHWSQTNNSVNSDIWKRRGEKRNLNWSPMCCCMIVVLLCSS